MKIRDRQFQTVIKLLFYMSLKGLTLFRKILYLAKMFGLPDLLNFRFSLSLFLDTRLISESCHGLSFGLIRTFLDGTQELTKSRKVSLNLEQAS